MFRALLILSTVWCLGCTSVRETQPERTATEQLIMSGAVIDAAGQIQSEAIKGKKQPWM